tara:strand:+ start:3094 stop:4083 length:990 start_codon:yes stop_codon:yes gene_type:complete
MNDTTKKQTADLMLREKRRQELGETTFNTGAQGGALMQPRNGKELMDMANMMAGCGTMVRDFYRNSPGDCAALIMICQPYGFNPYQVSWKTYKASKNADAPVSFEGQLVNAMLNMSAPVKGRLKYRYENEGTDNLTCTVIGIDKETGEEITYTSPPIKQIPVKNSPLWKGDPQQQLGYYSARAWARRHFPELLLGVYTREEIEEAPSVRDITPPQATGGWAQQAREARGEVMQEPEAEDTAGTYDDIEDAQMADDVDPDEEVGGFEDEGGTHWTADVDPDEGNPGSQAWDAGIEAFKQGAPITDCPHEDNMEDAQDWLGGYVGARRAAE